MKRNEDDKFKNIPESGYSVKIAKSAKLTDTLSSFMTPQSQIVSEKFIELIKHFRLPFYQVIPIKVYRVKELVTEKRYFIIHFCGDSILDINFKKSTFDYVSGGAFLDRSLLQFENYQDYLAKVKEDDRILMANIKRTIMKTTLKTDLFYLGYSRDLHCTLLSILKKRQTEKILLVFALKKLDVWTIDANVRSHK